MVSTRRRQATKATREDSEEKTDHAEELRKKAERGQFILDLAAVHGVKSTDLPLPTDQRNVAWHKITEQVNKEFGAQLGVLTVDTVKKRALYYTAKAERGSRGLAYTGMDETAGSEDTSFIAQETLPQGGGSSLDAIYDSTFLPAKEEEGDGGILETVMKTDSEVVVVDVLHDGGGGGEDVKEGEDALIPPSFVDNNHLGMFVKLSDNRSARTDFVVKWTKYYMERMCFREGQTGEQGMRFCRSHNANAERLHMWRKITELTNEKFAALLGVADVEQIKKMYTNRISRPRKTLQPASNTAVSPTLLLNPGLNTDPSQEPSTSSAWQLDYSPFSPSVLPRPSSARLGLQDACSSSSNSSDGQEPSAKRPNLGNGGEDKMDSLLRSLDKSGEVSQLKQRIVQNEAEIERLRKVIIEQADEHRRRMLGMLEMVKVGVNEQTAADIATALQV